MKLPNTNFLTQRRRGDGLLVQQLLNERGEVIPQYTISDIITGKKPTHPKAEVVLTALAEVIAMREQAVAEIVGKANNHYNALRGQKNL